MTRRYNHIFSIAFSVIDPSPTGDNLHPVTIRQAILTRLARCDDSELHEVIGFPEATSEIADEPPSVTAPP